MTAHRQVPALADGAHGLPAVRLDDRDHPLLRLGDQHLERLQAGLAARDRVEVDEDPGAAPVRRLGHGAGDPGGAEVLDADDEPLGDQLEGRLDQQLLRERVADLHRGRFEASCSPKVAEASTDAPPIPSRPVAVPYRTTRLPGTVGGRPGEHPVLEQPDRHHVDQRVALVGGVEHELAAHRRHADAVAVAADAAHDAVDEVPGPGVRRVAEPQRVEDGDRTGAHREHVAQDPADAGRSALVRLDGGRVVVALDLERDREPVADRDHARLLAHPGDDVVALRRQRREQRPARLVRAVLAPHDAEHRELEVVRVAAELRPDRVELDVGEAERAVERRRRDRRLDRHATPAGSAPRPRARPWTRTRARSRPASG